MADIVNKATRSRIMSAIPQRATSPERRVSLLLRSAGYRVQKNPRTPQGRPDVLLPEKHVVVFVHGCFWHAHDKCPYASIPSSNVHYWTGKLSANRKRDKRKISEWRKIGWKVIVVWSCALRMSNGRYAWQDRLLRAIRSRQGTKDISWRRLSVRRINYSSKK